MLGVVAAVLYVTGMAIVGLSALVGAVCIGDWAGEFWSRHGGNVGGVRAVGRAVRLRVTWWMRERRAAVRRVWTPVRIDAQRRWGYLRGAAVLFAVCVPVWVTRYQIMERVDGFTGGAVVWFRSAVSVNFGTAAR